MLHVSLYWGFQGGSVVKDPPASAGDAGDVSSIPGSGRSPGERNGNTLQYCCLENLVDREASQARVNRMAKESDIIQRLNNKNRGKSMFGRRKGMNQG